MYMLTLKMPSSHGNYSESGPKEVKIKVPTDFISKNKTTGFYDV